MSFLGRLKEGLLDPVYGASQLLENSVESLSPATAGVMSKAKVPYKPRFEEKTMGRKLSPYIARTAGDGGLLGVLAENYNSR